MSERYQIDDQNALYFMTSTVAGWIDVFSRPVYQQVIFDSLDYCRKHKGLHIQSYVLMTNHLHLIAWVEPPFEMSKVMHDFRSFTAHTILKLLEENGQESRQDWLLYVLSYFGAYKVNREKYQFWKDGIHPVKLFSDDFTLQKLNYIHQNPVRAGYVRKPEDWIASSAGDYEQIKGPVEVDLWWPSKFRTVR